MRKLLYLGMVLLYFGSAQAQNRDVDRVLLGGIIKNNLTSAPVPAVHVLNLTDSLATITSPEGAFKVPVDLGDSLVFSSIGYHSKALIITQKEMEADYIEVRLSPRDYQLLEVEVNPFGTKEQFRDRFMDLETDDGTVKIVGIKAPPKDPRTIPVTEDAQEIKKAKYLLNPASFIYGNLSKEAKARQELHRLEAQQEKHRYNYQKFNDEVVNRITGYEGDELHEFMDYCNFSEDQIYRYTEYELTVAILNKQRSFEASKKEKSN
ncbi:MAG: hypothetical protein GC178_09325 [Flavobacteriales bacterium]|nr:hypothetical protein [Flavobacteriales bacterium]